MDSSTEHKPSERRYDWRFVRNVFIAGFFGVGLGLLVAGASFVPALLIAVAAAVILALGFTVWGMVRGA